MIFMPSDFQKRLALIFSLAISSHINNIVPRDGDNKEQYLAGT